MRRILVCLALALVAQAQRDKYTAIECPVPGSPTSVDETTCNNYTACEYSDNSCHMRKNDEAGYIVASSSVNTGRGYMVNLIKANDSMTLFNQDITTLVFEVIYHENYHVQMKIYDPDNARYEVPFPLYLPSSQSSQLDYDVDFGTVGEPFHITVTRNSNEAVLFQQAGALTFEDQFIQFSTALTTDYLYGIGDQTHTQLRHTFDTRKTYPIFNRDQPVDTNEIANEYGTHPYYMNLENDAGDAHGVLFYSSNAMEFSTFSLTDGTPCLTTRSIGGIVDLHVFLGPSPEEVNVQYSTALGKALFPPYWLFGFQLSRWGYDSTDNYRTVRDRMRAAGIPQDVQVFDIDYMHSYEDFSYDDENWGDFPTLIDELHAENIKVVPIFDPAIVVDSVNNPPYARGKSSDVFTKWTNAADVPSDQPTDANDYVVGYVWPANKTVFPDFFKNETIQWWVNEVAQFYNSGVEFDGMWIDMNEPSNFGTNLDHPWNWPEGEPDWSLKCPTGPLDDPPYPTLAGDASYNECGRISDKTICMATTHTDGFKDFSHYDVHNLYGFSETLATWEAMEALYPGERHVILSRSTFVGSGRYAVHWLGDNSASWEQLQQSLISMMEYNLFVMPMVGSDVCGFFGEPTEELCIRWMQAGAFYPFDRNHNTNGTAPQDPANPAWPNCPTISKDVLNLRYTYIPYFYARFHRAHMNAASVIRPLFTNFPSDLYARDVDDQFMWSSDLLVAPVMEEGAVTRDVYFPDSLWYDLETGALEATGPLNKTVAAPLEKIPAFVRGGSILPWQEPGITTTDSRANPFGLTVALDANLQATGEIFWDNGVYEHVMSESYIGAVEFYLNELTLRGQYDVSLVDGVTLETIKIYGLTSTPTAVVIEGIVQPDSSWTYDSIDMVMVIFTSLPLNADFDMFINY